MGTHMPNASTYQFFGVQELRGSVRRRSGWRLSKLHALQGDCSGRRSHSGHESGVVNCAWLLSMFQGSQVILGLISEQAEGYLIQSNSGGRILRTG